MVSFVWGIRCRTRPFTATPPPPSLKPQKGQEFIRHVPEALSADVVMFKN